jgi:hypothetical protein
MEIRARSRHRNRIFGIGLIVVAVAALVFALWPTSYATETFTISSNLLPQHYQLRVKYPRFGPSGEQPAVEATLNPLGTEGRFPGPGEPGPVLIAEMQSADLGLSPEGQISTRLQPGTPVRFSWTVRAAAPGEAEFRLFFFMTGAQSVEGVYLQQPLWARVFPYDTFPGPGGFKYPLIFFAVLSGAFGLSLSLRHLLR